MNSLARSVVLCLFTIRGVASGGRLFDAVQFDDRSADLKTQRSLGKLQ